MMSATVILPKTAFQRAVDAFKQSAGLSAKDLHDLEVTTLPDLWKAIGRIRNEQKNSKKGWFLDRLSPFIEAMQQYSKVVEAFSNTSNLVAYIWGPIKLLLITTSNFTEAFFALLDGYMEIGENMPLLVQYQQLFTSNAYMQTALVTIFEDILSFHQEAITYFKKGVWMQLFHATWRQMRSKIAFLSKSLQQHKAIIEAQVTLLQYQEFQNLRAEEKTRFDHLQEDEFHRRIIAVQQWLCPISSLSRQENALERRFQGTGDWIFNDFRFQQWFNFDHCTDPLLWLNGMPGAGKTVLASTIIQRAQGLPRATVLYFYCQSSDEQKNGFLTVAKSLLSQLLTQNNALLPYLYEKVSKSGDPILTSQRLAKEMLETALKSCPKTYIIIDGLDEYSRDDRKEISLWFRGVVQSLPPHSIGDIRCLFISQDDGFARRDLPLTRIKLTVRHNKSDIEAFCRHWHKEIECKFGPLVRMEHNVANVVTARAEGMFLYARLVTLNLYSQETREDLESELDPTRLPDGLDQAYARITERLFGPASNPKPRSKSSLMLIGWLACAKRPFRWYEIQGAMAIDVDNGSFHPKRRFQDSCKDLCASLVEIGSDESVTLVHSTVKGYLIEQGYVKPLEVERNLATLCIGYLGFEDFEVDRADDVIREAIVQGRYSFADYAVCFWAIHVEAAMSSVIENGLSKSDPFVECLDVFLEAQWSGLTSRLPVSKTMEERLSPLRGHDCYEKACQAIIASKYQLRPATGNNLLINGDVLRVSKVNAQVREVFERIVSDPNLTPEIEALMKQFHGPNWFKCERLNCQFFYIGFHTAAHRQQHIFKHERAFVCSVEGCPQSFVGCVTEADLERHTFEHHGSLAEEDEHEFPPDEVEEVKEFERQQKGPSCFQCDICGRIFTRKHNLKAHMRSHGDERPYMCNKCDKKFTREQDRDRHRLTHSPAGARFVCKGKLQDGTEWGCGRRFSRSDALRRHYRTQLGRRCRPEGLGMEIDAAIEKSMSSPSAPPSDSPSEGRAL